MLITLLLLKSLSLLLLRFDMLIYTIITAVNTIIIVLTAVIIVYISISTRNSNNDSDLICAHHVRVCKA